MISTPKPYWLWIEWKIDLSENKKDNLKGILDMSFNDMIEKTTIDTINEYNIFYNMDIHRDDINFLFFRDRDSFDNAVWLWQKSENWVRAYAKGNNIYLFDIDVLEEVTWWYHKKDIWNYIRCVKHELWHSFYRYFLNKNYFRMNRLNEGMSIYLSWQLTEKTRPKKFEKFLNYWCKTWNGIYKEAWFVVELLINKYGKENIFQLITSLWYIHSEEEFSEKFKEIYWFELNYTNLNSL